MPPLLWNRPLHGKAEYVLALDAQASLQEKIMREKELFAQQYQCKTAVINRPHLVIARFTHYEMIENHLINRLSNIARGFPSFSFNLRNYGCKATHTIFIKAEACRQLTELKKELKRMQNLMISDNVNKPDFIPVPGIVIADRLLPWQYEKAWPEFEKRTFTQNFITNNLTWLKKKEGNQTYYNLMGQFEFKGERISVKQGVLF